MALALALALLVLLRLGCRGRWASQGGWGPRWGRDGTGMVACGAMGREREGGARGRGGSLRPQQQGHGGEGLCSGSVGCA